MRKISVLPFERILNLEESNLLKEAVLKAIRVFESWGYNYLKLPYFEFYESQKKTLGDRIKDSITFKDPFTGELICLREDFTVQVVKSVSFLRTCQFPLRIYYFGTVFSVGDVLERFQTGIELIGVPQVEGDAEVISAIYTYLKSLGFSNLKVSVGHIGVVEKVLLSVNNSKREIVRKAFKEKNLSLLRGIFGKDKRAELPLLQGGYEILNVLADIGFEEERELLEMLGKLLDQADVNFSYDLAEVREFPYYTGIVFEIFTPDTGFPIAGGGRYDRLSEVYGESFAATGGTVYLDRVLSITKPELCKKDFFILDTTEDKKYGFKVASYLRGKGYKVGRDIVKRSLKHSLEYAFSEGYNRVVVIEDKGKVSIYTNTNEFISVNLKEFLKLF